MRRSKTHLFFHLVWATDHRKQVLDGEIERAMHRSIQSEAQRLRCIVLALDGMPYHIHLVVQMPTTVSIAQLAKQVKGVSSAMANDCLSLPELFRWQENYAAFTVSRSHLNAVIDYVRRQKEHHAQNTTRPAWEETDEEVPGD